MKAVVFNEKNSVEIKTVPTPIPKYGEVLIAIKAAGLCVTDVHIIQGQFNLVQPPCILGHEIAGLVIELGDGVNEHLLYQRVIIDPGLSEHQIGFPPIQGGYAEFICVPWQNVHQISDNMPYTEAAILESFISPVGAAMRVEIISESIVFVQGLGPAGLAFVQAACLFGAKQIIVSDGNPQKLALAEIYGATGYINYRTENVAKKMSELIANRGVDIFFEATGNPKAIHDAIDMMAQNGKVILYGLTADDSVIELDYNEIILKQLQLFGSSGASWAWSPVLKYFEDGQFSVEKMVSKTFSLSEFKAAMDYSIQHHEAIKVVLIP